ncbi:MAG: hypothetical protein JXA99_16485 [Candidatus Lokiarchaeota archaeon]|nr:hypothetical protein [Candidatus Lokiarchaeota archaeon]
MLTDEYKIRANESDKFGYVKLSSLVGYLIETAGNDASQLNYGFDDLNKNGKYWVLSRLQIEIDKLPKWSEDISITTWPKKIYKLFALRDFIIRNQENQEIIKATSAWLVLDRITNKPNRIETVSNDSSWCNSKNAIEIIPDKIDTPDETTSVYSKKVLESDIDVNDHVNSCKYVDWITDCLNFQNYIKVFNVSIQINFLEAAKLYTDVQMRYSKISDVINYIEAINSVNNKKIVNSIIKFNLSNK